MAQRLPVRRRPLHRGTVKTALGLDVLTVDFGCVDEAARLRIFQFDSVEIA